MDVTRRQFVSLAMASILTGCSETTRQLSVHPSPIWPDLSSKSRMIGNSKVLAIPTANSKNRTSFAQSNDPSLKLNGIQVIPRTRWNTGKAIPDKMNRMDRITRITVHHEGSQAVWFSDAKSTAAHLDKIRKMHQDKNWGDIGYHYIIDRTGRVWQGRDIKYRGAHARDNNPGNVGVMVLGNFEIQQPTDAQIATLRKTLTALMQKYRVPANRVYTHRELVSTSCPGRNLQKSIVDMRRHRQIR